MGSHWMEMLDDIMTHTGQVRNLQKDAHHRTSVTSTSTVLCFAFSGSMDRIDEAKLRSETFDWSVVLPSTIKSYVDIGDAIVNVVDEDGVVVIASGIIRVLDDFLHWSNGRQFILAGVSRG